MAKNKLFRKIAEWRGSDFKHKPDTWRWNKKKQARRFRRKDNIDIRAMTNDDIENLYSKDDKYIQTMIFHMGSTGKDQ